MLMHGGNSVVKIVLFPPRADVSQSYVCQDLGHIKMLCGSTRETKAWKRINVFCVQCKTWTMCINMRAEARVLNGRR